MTAINLMKRQIKYFNDFAVKAEATKPIAYIIPQGWWKIIDLLKVNKIHMVQLQKDSSIEAESYRIEDYKSAARPYEMHHMNSEVKLSTKKWWCDFGKVTIIITDEPKW